MLVLAAVFAGGCGGSGGGGAQSSALPVVQSASVPGGISVKVVDQDGQAVPGAMVEMPESGIAVVTDSSGVANIGEVSAAAEGSPVRFSIKKAGYVVTLPTVRVYPDTAQAEGPQITLRVVRQPSSPDKAVSAEIVRAGGVSETVQPVAVQENGATVYKSVVDIKGDELSVAFNTAKGEKASPDVSFRLGSPDGSGPNASAVLGFTGQVTAEVTYGDPTDAEALEYFPGEFLTQSDTGSGPGEGTLVTAGFVNITLKDEQGREITQFAPGTEAVVEMTVPQGVQNPETGAPVVPGDTIPIFVYDENAGEWFVEHNADGTVKRSTIQSDGGRMFVRFTTTHLTWFNLDWKGVRCPDNTPKISFVDAQGNPVSGVTVYTYTDGGWRDDPRYVADSFVTFKRAPADITWKVWAEKDGITTDPVTINSCGEYTIVIKAFEPECSTDAQCDDSDPLTTDVCSKPGTKLAACVHTACSSACSSDAACADSNENTVDVCANPGTCQAACMHTACNPSCTGDTQCNDGDPLTLDVCSNAGTCSAACTHTACDMACTGDSGCRMDMGGGQFFSGICVNKGTCDAYCDYSECPVACSTGTGCSDGDPLTHDACDNPGTCYAVCRHSSCTAACSNDAQCDDGNPLTSEVCRNAGTCDAVCMVSSACTPLCSDDFGCNDNNPLTIDVCSSPGTCSASCANTSCTPVCANDAQCDDGVSFTTDTCENANTCGATCTHSGGQWEPFGGAASGGGLSATYGNSFRPAIARDAFGNVVAAWQDDSSGNNEIYVRRWNGSFWEEIGGGSASGGGISSTAGDSIMPSVATDITGVIVVAWQDNTSGNYEIYVKKWNGAEWAALGGSASGGGITNNAGQSVNPSVALDPWGNPAVAWQDNSHNNRNIIYLRKWNGNAWAEVGGSATEHGVSNSIAQSMYPSLAVDNAGAPVVAWTEISNSGTRNAYVRKWKGTSWGSLGANPIARIRPDGTRFPTLSSPDIELDAGGNPVVSFLSDGGSGVGSIFYVTKWSGSAWQDFAGAQSAAIGAQQDITAHEAVYDAAAGRLTVVWGAGRIYVKQYSDAGGNVLEMTSGDGLAAPSAGASFPSVALDQSGNPFVAWQDDASGNSEIFIKKWQP